MLLFSKFLSLITFGNTEQMYALCFHLYLFFKQLTTAELAILQGFENETWPKQIYTEIWLLVSIPLVLFLWN
jgi:hypothetical protein